ncbi:MAG TPA: sugar ABC transporter permease [Solirubrobacteraceae bacterium]|nr:sugar ABC transporter permease [Solirubrobacteraceae bacterium]
MTESLSGARRRGDVGYLVPMLVLVGAVVLVPAGVAIFHSFTDWRPGGESPWVGLANYREFLSNPVTGEIVKNTAVLLIGVPLWTALPLLLAFALHERTRATGFFRAVFFFPAVLSPAIIGIMFRGILAPEGLVNELLLGVGVVGEPVLWLDEASLVKPTLIFVLAWASVGAGTILFAAAMTSVDNHLLEAAKLDGANWLQRLRYVVLPGIASVVAFWVVYQVVSVFLYVFGWIFILTRGGPGYSSTTLDFDVYQNAFANGLFGYASAQAVCLLVIAAIVVIVGFPLARRTRRA